MVVNHPVVFTQTACDLALHGLLGFDHENSPGTMDIRLAYRGPDWQPIAITTSNTAACDSTHSAIYAREI